MNYLVLDWETSNYNFGSAFDPRNFPVALVALKVEGESRTLLSYHYLDESVSNCTLLEITSLIEETHGRTDIQVVGHNLRFDLHWNNRVSIKYGDKLFDTMFLPYLELCGQHTQKDTSARCPQPYRCR